MRVLSPSSSTRLPRVCTNCGSLPIHSMLMADSCYCDSCSYYGFLISISMYLGISWYAQIVVGNLVREWGIFVAKFPFTLFGMLRRCTHL
jgi:hypothetical protein